ncbi:putative serine/threonine-protein kinase [Hordeum vulgare]|nr:putative serine/threonine-protein kinase [Hordeum vulgare]
MMALDLPQKTIMTLNKVCRGFLWCAKDRATGGQCLVSWEEVCTPKWAGGLGIPNLKWLNIAMQARWPWLQRVDRSRPWAEFDIDVPQDSLQLFNAAAHVELGSGEDVLLWKDRWLDGYRLEELVLALYFAVRRGARDTQTVSHGLRTGDWATDVGPQVSKLILSEYFMLWEHLAAVELVPGEVETVWWAWETGGEFSTRSAYNALF